MSPKILLNLASRSRPAKFHTCMQNLRQCFTDYEVALKVDRNDPTLKEYFKVYYPEIILSLGYSKSKVHAINRDIPKTDWDIIVNTSDDIMWKPGAGKEIIKNMEPDTFLHFPEPYADAKRKLTETISVVSIVDRTYYERFGYIYHPDYKSLWCDNEATAVARELKRYRFVNKEIFEHLHPVWTKAKKDDQYKKTESYNSVDKQTFLRRKKNGFINTYTYH